MRVDHASQVIHERYGANSQTLPTRIRGRHALGYLGYQLLLNQPLRPGKLTTTFRRTTTAFLRSDPRVTATVLCDRTGVLPGLRRLTPPLYRENPPSVTKARPAPLRTVALDPPADPPRILPAVGVPSPPSPKTPPPPRVTVRPPGGHRAF